uniref:SCP domain-containing protein n=1 Tax=Anopheles atroparvus TaxID=41427 RepID=A0AAG5D7J0_ANOAO
FSFTSFQKNCLERHNVLRAKHSAAPLVLDAGLCQYAQEWATYLASINRLQHRPVRKYGENCYAKLGGPTPSASSVVNAWYNEIKYYTFGAPSPHNFSQVGHFTALVWKKSRKLGVGIAKRGTYTYVVANYDPHGNYFGQYHLNRPLQPC